MGAHPVHLQICVLLLRRAYTWYMVCVCVCVCVCVRARACACTSACVPACLHLSACACTCVCTCMCVQAPISACMLSVVVFLQEPPWSSTGLFSILTLRVSVRMFHKMNEKGKKGIFPSHHVSAIGSVSRVLFCSRNVARHAGMNAKQ